MFKEHSLFLTVRVRGGGGLAKSIRKTAPPPTTASRIHGEKITPPPHDTKKIFAPTPHIIKTCLYVSVLFPQQL